jgi:hypothetical protein
VAGALRLFGPSLFDECSFVRWNRRNKQLPDGGFGFRLRNGFSLLSLVLPSIFSLSQSDPSAKSAVQFGSGSGS